MHISLFSATKRKAILWFEGKNNKNWLLIHRRILALMLAIKMNSVNSVREFECVSVFVLNTSFACTNKSKSIKKYRHIDWVSAWECAFVFVSFAIPLRRNLMSQFHFYQFVCHINKDYKQLHCHWLAMQMNAKKRVVWMDCSCFYSVGIL